jgi:hypothetical protein
MATASDRFVYNHDVAGIHARVNRFLTEMALSQSNGTSQVIAYDQARLQSYIAAIRTYKQWVLDQPLLDLPETHPTKYPLDPDPTLPEIENESIRDVLRMLLLAREELVNGQSARMSSGLIKFDDARFSAVIDKVENFLKNYIATTTPLDFPESSPMDPMAPAGKIGV